MGIGATTIITFALAALSGNTQNYCARENKYMSENPIVNEYWHFKRVGYQEISHGGSLALWRVMVVGDCPVEDILQQ